MSRFALTNPFTKPFDFAMKRNAWQAFGFYLAHLMLYLIVVGVMTGFLMAPAMLAPNGAELLEPNNPQLIHMAQQMGMPVNAGYALFITYFMLRAKNIDPKRNIRAMAIGIVALLLGILSPIFGLMAIAGLSTRSAESSS